ncbi:DUF4421 domain-containing protein [Formosa sp. S-31]|uniref:DUF4421 domain-containing protein n=1 Tax=Formosa sp. S-31 TaxID=2790949 RepID=UPI003EB76E18
MGLKKWILSIALILSFSTTYFAQDTNQTVENDSLAPIVYSEANDYIHIYKNRITARLFFVNTSNSLSVIDHENDINYDLAANKQNRIGASLAFRAINISYSFAPDFLSENKDNDDSKLFNFNIRTYLGKHWMQTLEIYKEKGFYIQNDDISFYLPRTKFFKIGGATSYILNENFSFRAIASQDEKQLKSVGSFIPSLVYYYTYYHVIWDMANPEDSIDGKSHSFDIALAPSYYYNFVPTKNLFISAGFSIGLGMHYSKEESGSETSLLSEVNLRGSVNYDIDNLYLGSHYNLLVLNYNTDSAINVSDNIPYFQIFVGYRFKAGRKMIKTADEFNNKLKL